jgi:hypothetical protein
MLLVENSSQRRRLGFANRFLGFVLIASDFVRVERMASLLERQRLPVSLKSELGKDIMVDNGGCSRLSTVRCFARLLLIA